MEYSLKLKASRQIISEISKKYPIMPFTLRQLDSKQTRLGLVECVQHGLLNAYPVLYEKQGEFVAQIKSTVLLLPNGLDRVTVPPSQSLQLKHEKSLDEKLKEMLNISLKYKKKAKKGKGKGGADQNKEEQDGQQ